MNNPASWQFDLETAVAPLGEDCWGRRLHPAWNIGENLNGGYLVAVALNALSQTLPHPDPISVTSHFLRPGKPDTDCEVTVATVRTGRTLTTARASLTQEGKGRLEMIAAFADLARPAGVDAELTLPEPDLPGPDECVPRTGDTQGVDLSIVERVDARLHPDHVVAGATGQAEMSGWIRFADGRPPDVLALPLFADAFPPSPFGLLGVVGWVPTIELTVHVRRRPAPGWIKAVFKTEDLHQGRMVESGALWDATGALVAQSRQIGLVLNRD